MDPQTAVDRLKDLDRQIRVLLHAQSVLNWDRETQMPEAAVEERAEQISAMEGIIHGRITSEEIGALLQDAGASEENPSGEKTLVSLDRAFLRRLHRLYRRHTKLPSDLVTDTAKTASRAQSVWRAAREESEFEAFAPHLKRLLELRVETADRLGYEEHPYDALLDEFEPWTTTRFVSQLFGELRQSLVPLVKEIGSARQGENPLVGRRFPRDGQEAFGRFVLEHMGYEFTRGRLDVSAHPFTDKLGRDDVRVTTRYNEEYLGTSLFGTIHEGGHALYEQGFPKSIKELILGEGASMGIHESQSRLWENFIGRSRSFWRYFYPKLVDQFPDQLHDISLDDFYRAINRVEPSFIRVEADEVTYNLHIILRFNLEKRLVAGELTVEDLPEAWREESKELLGIAPKKDADGVLQDVHWSFGAFGYFPSYALGNLYAAQFYASLRAAVGDLDEQLGNGDLSPVLSWLRSNVHAPGSTLTPTELCEEVTGSSLDAGHFTSYLREKYAGIYELR
ncbi:MAG: carboxypeptidase M32 [Spirochaetaceae bacterium]